MACPVCKGGLHPHNFETPSSVEAGQRCSACELTFFWIGESEVQVSVHDEGHADLDEVHENATSDDLCAAAALLTRLGADKYAAEARRIADERTAEEEYAATPKWARREYQPNFF
jgi:hypothetical protein